MMGWIVWSVIIAFGLFAVFWLISLSLGLFLPKERLGLNWIKKRLREYGVDLTHLLDAELMSVVKAAHLSSHYDRHPYGKYDATAFKNYLDFWANCIARKAHGHELSTDEDNLLNHHFTRSSFHSSTSSS